MRNQSSYPVLQLAPELWAGVHVSFDDGFNKAFKELVSCSAWDPVRKTRWFPISYLAHVKQLVREHRLVLDSALDTAHEWIQRELERRRAVRIATSVDGEFSGPLSKAYETLGLHPSAPTVLVQWALMFWRKELGSLGAPTTRLLEIEEAYRVICAGPQQHNED